MGESLETEIIKTIQQILPKMSNEAKIEFINKSENELAIFHFGFGTWIRNNILTEHGNLYKVFVENGFGHKDDMSAMIIQELHKYLWK